MKKFYLAILFFLTPLFMLNAQNLVLNGGFESWDDATTPTSWTKVENANQEAVIVNTGTYSCKHIGGTKDIGQTIPVTPGTNYELSVSYYIEAGDGTDCRLWSWWKEGTTSLDDNLAELRPSTYFPGDASWKTSTVTITAPATATDLYLEIRTYSGAIVYLDDISLVAVVETGPDATLSDLTIDATTIDGFNSAIVNYTVDLAGGTVIVPTVAYILNDANATAAQVDATDLTGDAAARTTTISVTAVDGTTIKDYTILFNPILEVATIADLRAVTDLDRTYTVTGEVVLTHKDSYRSKKYFEDATGAIEIDDDPGAITSTYEIGDGVTGLTGTIEDYYGFLQLHPTADPGTATTTANLVEPQLLTVTEFNTNFNDYAAEFVKIEGVTFADAGATFANSNNYNVSVGDDITVFRTAFFDVVSGTIPTNADIQGIAIWHFSEAKIAPRMAADLMIDYTSVALNSITSISVYPVPASDELVVKGLGNSKSFVITNILGSTVKTVNVTSDEMRVNITNLEAGIYMILTNNSAIRFIKK